MSNRNTVVWLERSDRVYRLLLHTYPAGFRSEYGPLMAQAFRDSCGAALRRSGPSGLAALWLHTVVDWAHSASEQHVREALHMSARRGVIGLGALAALIGGILGIWLVAGEPNSYGNYGWDGWMAALTALLLALGVAGAITLLKDQLTRAGRWGIYAIFAGLLLMSFGFVLGPLWPFIFLGPLVIAPIGAVFLGMSVYQDPSLPAGWRWYSAALVAIALCGFTIELLEGVMGNSTPDRGVQLSEALLSILWIVLGVGLWMAYRDTPDGPQIAA